MDATGKALVDHWGWAIDKGLMNRNTASALRAACTQVLSILEDWESVDINKLEVNDVINRFKNLKARDFKPQTLDAYERRFLQAVQSFQDFNNDPSSWPKSKTRSGIKRNKSETNPQKTVDVVGDSNSLVRYPFPLRRDIIVDLSLPNDLTSAEVKRLHTFMQALVVDFGDDEKGREADL